MNPSPAPAPLPPDPDFDQALDRAALSLVLQVEVAAPPEATWEILVDVPRWPLWHRGIQVAILRAEAPEPGVRLDWQAEGMRIRSVLFEVLPRQRLAWSLATLGGTGALRWTLEPLPGGGTRVTLEEWWNGITARILRGTLRRTLTRGRTAWLEALANRVEKAAKDPPPEGTP
jgi:hypothetical protein